MDEKPKTVPFVISEKVWANVYKNHKKGTAMVNFTLLTYDSKKIEQAKQRRASVTASASVMYVLAKENMQHGGALGVLIRITGLETDDIVQVILLPDNSKKEPLQELVLSPLPAPIPESVEGKGENTINVISKRL